VGWVVTGVDLNNVCGSTGVVVGLGKMVLLLLLFSGDVVGKVNALKGLWPGPLGRTPCTGAGPGGEGCIRGEPTPALTTAFD